MAARVQRIAGKFASAVAAFAIASSVAQAAPITLQVYTDSGATYDSTVEGTPSTGNTFVASGYGHNSIFSCNWGATFEEDPFYLVNFTITNLSVLPQIFTLNVTLPVSPAIPGSSVMGGYFGDLTYTDQNLNSTVTINTVGATPFFQAKIDGAGAPTIPALGSFSANASGGPGVYGTLSQLSFGAPIPSMPGPGVSSSIGGTVVFELTAGDRAVFPIYFQVNPVPEPAAALLVGFGALGLAAIRQRRS